MRTVRRLHLYLGCFFAPLLLFYVATGWYQTFNPNRAKTAAESETWLMRLRQVHVDQIYPSATAQGYSPRLFRGLVAVMALALSATVALGVFLAFRGSRTPWPVALCLVLGVLVPALLLWLGQRR